jgi:membrane-associated protein
MLTHLIITFGYLGVFVTLFAESGFLLGFFLPGDSLLFTVGLLASQGYFDILTLSALSITAAITGDSFGYYMGHKFGRQLFEKYNTSLFKKEYVERTEKFYQKYGKKTIIIARFVPIVRTFAPIMAGVGNMKYSVFLTYNVVGGFLWAGGLLWLSYWLAGQFPELEHYLGIAILVIIILSVVPILFEFLRKKNRNT